MDQVKHGEHYDGHHELPILIFTTSVVVVNSKSHDNQHTVHGKKKINALQPRRIKN